jgi:ribosomal 50S subunit-associated protein YjgA (DUF615 family)
MREEKLTAQKNLEDLNSSANGTNADEDSSEQAKFELLVKRDQDMTTFMESFPDTRNGFDRSFSVY